MKTLKTYESDIIKFAVGFAILGIALAALFVGIATAQSYCPNPHEECTTTCDSYYPYACHTVCVHKCW